MRKMITLEELWYAWFDIDEHTEVHLAFDGEDEFDTFKFSERDKWRRYDKRIVKVFAVIQSDGQFLATRGAFDKVMIILKG